MSGPGEGDGDNQPRNASEVWDRLQALPSMQEDPLVWDHRAGGFVRQSQLSGSVGPAAAGRVNPAPSPPPPSRAATVDPTMVAPAPPNDAAAAGRPRRHVVVNPDDAPPGSTAGSGSGSPSGAIARPLAAPAAPAAPAAVPSRNYQPPPQPPTRGRGAPSTPGAPPKPMKIKRRGRGLRRAVLGLVLIPLLVFGGLFAFGWYKFAQVPRTPVSASLSPGMGTGTNILIVGTDSREGINASDPNSGAFIGEAVSGARTDSIMVLHTGAQQSLLSIPRDLWVKNPKTGQMDRINATYADGGAPNLIKAVQSLGIPVQQYVEINFVSFGKLVDSVGGIDVDFAYPSRDQNSGLVINEAGVHHLDGTMALAYVRSRHFQEQKDGKWVEDPLSDLGRVQRQRAFLTSLLGQVTNTKNPLELSRITDALTVGLKLDDAMNFLDATKLGWALKSFHPQSVSLPVTPRTTAGGAAVLDLKQPDASTLIDQFNRGTIPAPDPSPTPTTAPAPSPAPTTAKKKK